MPTAERPRQLNLQEEVRTVKLTDLSPIVQAANSSNEPIIIYGEGIKGIDECFRDLTGWFGKLDGRRPVEAFHWEEFSSKQPESKQEESILIIGPVFEFDNQQLKKAIRNIALYTKRPVIFLIPVWPTTGKLELFERWANFKKTPSRFKIDPESVPGASHEEILKLAPEPKRELRENIVITEDEGLR